MAQERGHPLVRAVALYLDLCFYHPFADGNARAARLVFDFVLWQARIGIAELRPVFALPRVAGDAAGYLDFLRLVIALSESRGAQPALRRLAASTAE